MTAKYPFAVLQLVHEVVPSVSAYVSAAQFVHADEEALAVFPLYFPAGQSWHDSAPVTALNVPEAQFSQLEPELPCL